MSEKCIYCPQICTQTCGCCKQCENKCNFVCGIYQKEMFNEERKYIVERFTMKPPCLPHVVIGRGSGKSHK